MRRLVLSLAALALTSVPAVAQVFRAENRVVVTPASGGFEISDGAGFGARGMWCGAADYAQSVLGARGTDRLYVARGRSAGPGARGPVLFTLDPTGLVPRSFLIVGTSLGMPGATLTVAHAYQFCTDAKVIDR